METYLLINIVFILGVILAFRIKIKKPSKKSLLLLAILLVMTAVFDSIIVGLDIVSYVPSNILGIYIGNAPIEDFFYAVLAVLLVPTVWNMMEKKHVKKS